MVLISGTSLAQGILVVATPVLTRLYSPHEFGVLALFLAVTSTLAVAANGRYDQAIIVADTFEDAIEVCVLSILTSLGVSLALLLPIIAFNGWIADALGSADLRLWLYFVPLAVFLNCFLSALTNLSNRMERYGPIAKVTVLRALASVTLQILFGFVSPGVKGLMLGQMFSYAVANGALLPSEVRERLRQPGAISGESMRRLAGRFREFPLYSAPAGLLNLLNQNIVNIMLSALFSPAAVGLYAITRRTLSAPLAQIAMPIGQVFFRQASEEVRSSGSARKAFDSTVTKLGAMSIPLFGVAYFVVEPVFRIVFGDKWAGAGEFAKILIPLFAVRFIVSPLSQLAAIGRNRELLAVNAALVIGGAAPFYVADRLGWSVQVTLGWTTAICSAIYLLYLVRLRQLAR